MTLPPLADVLTAALTDEVIDEVVAHHDAIGELPDAVIAAIRSVLVSALLAPLEVREKELEFWRVDAEFGLSQAEARAESAEARVSALTAEREALMDCGRSIRGEVVYCHRCIACLRFLYNHEMRRTNELLERFESSAPSATTPEQA